MLVIFDELGKVVVVSVYQKISVVGHTVVILLKTEVAALLVLVLK